MTKQVKTCLDKPRRQEPKSRSHAEATARVSRNGQIITAYWLEAVRRGYKMRDLVEMGDA